MSESKRDEHARLQRRTHDLEQEHDDLGLDRKRFDKAEHDQHTRDLQKHKVDLEQHRRRAPDPDA